MRVLLDTHVFLWWLSDDPQLGQRVRAAITDSENDVFVSAVSIAEIAIKKSLGKLRAPPGLLTSLAEEGFRELPLRSPHSAVLESLPFHHRDPFDRMLIAQAISESLTLASYDSRVQEYDFDLMTG